MRDGAKKDNSKMECTNILNDISAENDRSRAESPFYRIF